MANKGSYTWLIDGDLYQRMLKAKVGDKFLSDVILMANLKWKLGCYPNGGDKREQDSFKIGLRLKTLPRGWKSVVTHWRIECIETSASNTALCTYDGDHRSWGWRERCLLLSELRKLDVKSISIKVTIKVIKIESKQAPQNIFHTYCMDK